jgi:hypothetical protein
VLIVAMECEYINRRGKKGKSRGHGTTDNVLSGYARFP